MFLRKTLLSLIFAVLTFSTALLSAQNAFAVLQPGADATSTPPSLQPETTAVAAKGIVWPKKIFNISVNFMANNKTYHSSQGYAVSNFTADLVNTMVNVGHPDHFYTDIKWADQNHSAGSFYPPQKLNCCYQEGGIWRAFGDRNRPAIAAGMISTEALVLFLSHKLSSGGPKSRALATGLNFFWGTGNLRGWISWRGVGGNAYKKGPKGFPKELVHWY